jgi:hypothetical protein
MTVPESSKNNAVEVDGIQFETLVPEREQKIPNVESKTKVQFGIRNYDSKYRLRLIRKHWRLIN